MDGTRNRIVQRLTLTAKFLSTFKDYPQSQPVGSLSIEKVLKQMASQSARSQ